jgi:hypothetical protein
MSRRMDRTGAEGAVISPGISALANSGPARRCRPFYFEQGECYNGADLGGRVTARPIWAECHHPGGQDPWPKCNV